MHITEWEASRSGAGITVAMVDAGGVRHKQFVKKIEAKGATITAIGGDGARFDLTRRPADPGDTSAEVASIAAQLLTIDEATLDTLDSGTRDSMTAAQLIENIRKVAASCLGQRQ